MVLTGNIERGMKAVGRKWGEFKRRVRRFYLLLTGMPP
jgi:hypothetical protein